MQLPLELFVLVGSFTEEVISPIPSVVVMIPAGVAASVQGAGWWYLLALGLLGGLGRMLGAMILYFVADKAEDWLFGRGRRLFGVTHNQVESFGQRFSGRTRDFALLFLLNAVPVVPTSLLSLTCGFIRINFKMFAAATFLGAAFNAVFYMAIGYAGVRAIAGLENLQTASRVVGIILLAALGSLLVYYYVRKKRGR